MNNENITSCIIANAKCLVSELNGAMLKDEFLEKSEAIMQIITNDNEIIDTIVRLKQILTEKSRYFINPLELEFRLPNASVGKKYSHKLTIHGKKLGEDDRFVISHIEELSNTIDGLTLDSDTGILFGTPLNDGDFNLKVKGVYVYASGVQLEIDGNLKLTINPDPKSLWKDIPPDENGQFYKSNEEKCHLISQDNMRILSASKRGRSHANAGTFREDDAKISIESPNGWSIQAVADGGGSYSLSRRGSQIAVNHSVAVLEKLLTDELSDELEKLLLKQKEFVSDELTQKIHTVLTKSIISTAYNALYAIEKEAKSINEPLKEFSTTLLLSAHKKVESGHMIITFWIGDGVVVLYRKNQEAIVLGVPDSGEYAGQTRFLDSIAREETININKRATANIVKDFTALILATDGISDPFFKHSNDLYDISKWDELWEYDDLGQKITQKDGESASIALLEWLDFWEVGNHDDRTISLLLPPESYALEQTMGEEQGESSDGVMDEMGIVENISMLDNMEEQKDV